MRFTKPTIAAIEKRLKKKGIVFWIENDRIKEDLASFLSKQCELNKELRTCYYGNGMASLVDFSRVKKVKEKKQKFKRHKIMKETNETKNS